jgi:hypothetical protein
MLQMLRMAEQFHESASRALDGADALSEEAVYQSLCYALELGLKAFVRASGWSDERCRREIRHDLVKACRAAVGAGLPVQGPETMRMLVVLTPFYATHTLEDFVRGSSFGLDREQSVQLTGEILERVRRSLEQRNAN